MLRLTGTLHGREVNIEVLKNESRTIGRRQLDIINACIPQQLCHVRLRGSTPSDSHLFIECMSHRVAIAVKGRDSSQQFKKLSFRQTFRLFPGDQLLVPDGGSGILLDVSAEDEEQVLTQPTDNDVDALIEAHRQRTETATTSNRTSPTSDILAPKVDAINNMFAAFCTGPNSRQQTDHKCRSPAAEPTAAPLAPLDERRRKSLSTNKSPHFLPGGYDPSARVDAGLPPVPNARRQSMGSGRLHGSQLQGVKGATGRLGMGLGSSGSSSMSPEATQHEAVFHQFSAVKQEQRARERMEQSQAGMEGHDRGLGSVDTAQNVAAAQQSGVGVGASTHPNADQPLLLPHLSQSGSLTQPEIPVDLQNERAAVKAERILPGGALSESPSTKRSSDRVSVETTTGQHLPVSPPLSPTQLLPHVSLPTIGGAAPVGQGAVKPAAVQHSGLQSTATVANDLEKTVLMNGSSDVVEVEDEEMEVQAAARVGAPSAASAPVSVASAPAKRPAGPPSTFSQFLRTGGRAGDQTSSLDVTPEAAAQSSAIAVPGSKAAVAVLPSGAASTNNGAATYMTHKVKRRAKLIPDDDDEEPVQPTAANPAAVASVEQAGSGASIKGAALMVIRPPPAAASACVRPSSAQTDDDVQVVSEEKASLPARTALRTDGRKGPRVKGRGQTKARPAKQTVPEQQGRACGDTTTVNILDADDDDRLDPETEADRALVGGVCTVCREDMANVAELGRLLCGHVYCFDCIRDWSKVTNGCCLCKQQFFAIRRVVRILAPLSTSSAGDGAPVARTGAPRYCRTDMYRVQAKRQRIAGMEAEDAALAAELQAEEGDGLPYDDDGEEEEQGGFAYRASFEEMTGRDVEEAEEDWVCRVCNGKEDDETTPNRLLMCDACDSVTHMACLPNPLTIVPDGLWLCDDCEVDGAMEYPQMGRSEYVQMRQAQLAQQRVEQKRDQGAEEEDVHSVPLMSQRSHGSKRSGGSNARVASHTGVAAPKQSARKRKAGQAKSRRRAKMDLVVRSDDEADSDSSASASSESDSSSSSGGESVGDVDSDGGGEHDDSTAMLRKTIGNRPTTMQRPPGKGPVPADTKARPAAVVGKKISTGSKRGLKGYDPEDDFVVPEDEPIVQSQWSEDNGMPSDDEELVGGGRGGKKRRQAGKALGKDKPNKRGRKASTDNGGGWESARGGLGPDDFYKAQLAEERQAKRAAAKTKKKVGTSAADPQLALASTGPALHSSGQGRAMLQAYAYAGGPVGLPGAATFSGPPSAAAAAARPAPSAQPQLQTAHAGSHVPSQPLVSKAMPSTSTSHGIQMLAPSAGVGKGTRDMNPQYGRVAGSGAGLQPVTAHGTITSAVAMPVPAHGSSRAQQMAAAGVLGAQKKLLSKVSPVVQANLARPNRPGPTPAIYGSQGNNTSSGLSGSDTSAASAVHAMASPLPSIEASSSAAPVRSSYFGSAPAMAPPPQPTAATGHVGHVSGAVKTYAAASSISSTAAAPAAPAGPLPSSHAVPYRPLQTAPAAHGGMQSAPASSHGLHARASSSVPGFVSALPRPVATGPVVPRPVAGSLRQPTGPARLPDLYETQFPPTLTGDGSKMDEKMLL